MKWIDISNWHWNWRVWGSAKTHSHIVLSNGNGTKYFDQTPDEDLDLKVPTIDNSWKRWSVGSDSNGEYAKVNGLEIDLGRILMSTGTSSNTSTDDEILQVSLPLPVQSTPPKKPPRLFVNGLSKVTPAPIQQPLAKSSLKHLSIISESSEPVPILSLPDVITNEKAPLVSSLPKKAQSFLHYETNDSGEICLIFEDKWRILFDQFDYEGFGEIPMPDFLNALKSKEFVNSIEPGKLQILEETAKESSTTAITFQHFVNIMSGKRSRSFKCAVHQRDREVCSESDFHLLPFEPTEKRKPSFHVKRMARLIADEFLTDERDRKYYADHYRCLPPPLFIISVTLIELGFFTYYTVWHGEVSSSGPLPIDSIFVYRPDKRQEVWRFLFYMVLHAGWVHLMFNLLVQLLVGLPLEMVHGSTRIGCIYMAGVLAGSLGTSVFDPDVYLVGASGGVYALLAAHLANVLLNYNNMEFGMVRLLGVFLIASVDVGFAIYDRYAADITLTDGQVPPVSYVAHLTGALAGLTIGLLVLKNFEQKLREQLMWWLALGVYGACTLFAILFNIFHPVPPRLTTTYP